jgi:hypothetical protein
MAIYSIPEIPQMMSTTRHTLTIIQMVVAITARVENIKNLKVAYVLGVS